MNRSSLLAFENDQQNRGQPGLTAGLFYEIRISNRITLISELNVTQKGGSHERIQFSGTFNLISHSYCRDDIRLYAIDVPLIFKLKIWKRFSILCGPQLSGNFRMRDKLLFNSTERYSFGSGRYENLLEIIYANYQATSKRAGRIVNVGAIIGTSYQFNKKYAIDLRYELGITPLTTSNSEYPISNKLGYLRNNIFSLSLNVCLPIKRYKSVHPPEWYLNQPSHKKD